MTNTEQILEFNKIKEKLIEYSYTQKAKEKFKELKPYLEEIKVHTALRETSEAKHMIEKCGNPPAVTLNGIDELTDMARKGECLSPEQLENIISTLTAIRRLKDYLNRCKQYDINLGYIACTITR